MIESYIRRIGFDARPRPDLATLAALQRLHLAAIPFEAIDVLAGRRIDLALPAIAEKIIAHGRGGYCFEQNRLFESVLLELGFTVRRAMARVLWRKDPAAPRPPRSHLCLIVTIEGVEWLVDVGFGGAVPEGPLLLASDEEQQAAHDHYRFQPGVEGRLLTIYRDGAWLPTYEILLGAAELADLESANWFASTHPASPFRAGLAISLCTPEARYGLLGREFSTRFVDGRVERRVLTDDEIHQSLRRDFRLLADLPDFPIPE